MSASPVVDAHQHFWRYDPAEYGWIDDDLAALRRDFLPADLGREIAAAGVALKPLVEFREVPLPTQRGDRASVQRKGFNIL